jgi:hypothetical protein
MVEHVASRYTSLTTSFRDGIGQVELELDDVLLAFTDGVSGAHEIVREPAGNLSF